MLKNALNLRAIQFSEEMLYSYTHDIDASCSMVQGQPNCNTLKKDTPEIL